MSGRSLQARVCAVLAGLYPWEVAPSDDLRGAVTFLDSDLDAESVVRAGYGLGLVTATVGLAGSVLFGFGMVGATVSVALGLVAIHLVHETPGVVALARRTRALGRAPDLVARTVLRMRLEPSPERAAAFAAETGEGPLATSLSAHVRRARATGGDALAAFGAEWAEWYPDLERALGLVSAAGGMDRLDRDRTLDRALTAVLGGTRSGMREFAARIGRPVTGLYAFGVLLPTALVALLPAASAAGVGITTPTVVILYDVLLPLGILAAGVWLVVRRPVAFPPPDVDRSHPDVPDRRRTAVWLALGSGAVSWLIAGRLLPGWAGPIAAVGFGFGSCLWLFFRPLVAVYDRVREVESGLADALALVGRRVANGEAVESALAAGVADLDGAMGDVLDRAVTRQRQLNVGVRAAFLGTHGALADVPSYRVRASVAILGLAAGEGKPVGPALLALSEHAEQLRRVERESRQDLAEICGTLRNTGTIFGPMVAGATVAMADGLAAGSRLPGGGETLPGLGPAVGGYVLVFAVVLPALATSLSRGFDGPLVGYHVGRSLLVATPVYLGSYLVVAGIA